MSRRQESVHLHQHRRHPECELEGRRGRPRRLHRRRRRFFGEGGPSIHRALGDLVHEIIERDRPLFGACWGHQFLVKTTGGTVVEDPEQEEIGTFAVSLTPDGIGDPLFSEFPASFWAQLGHKDSATELGPGWRELGHTRQIAQSGIRLEDKPVYGTQFHSELNEERLRERLLVYLDDYIGGDQEEFEKIIRGLRPSIDADRMMARFLELYA